MTRIVTYAHRYKRPPKKRKAVALEVAVVTPGKGRAGNDNRAEIFPAPVAAQTGEPPLANNDRKPVIVTARKARRPSVFGDALELTPEEHRQRGDAADALWREVVRRAVGGE